MEIQILDIKTKSKICIVENIANTSNVKTIKDIIHQKYPKYNPNRQSLRLEPKSKSLKDEDVLNNLSLGNGNSLYFKDLGPQIPWSTVFYCEYSGPLIAYLLFYFKIIDVYGDNGKARKDVLMVVKLAAFCHTFHYVKRILETKFIHRFSHNAMPLRNLFKNTSYYTLFGAWIAYFINHPLYTPPKFGDMQVYIALVVFAFCEMGNFSIHIALKNLRPSGSKERKVPYPTANPFTLLFNYVSCPNYTYEVCSWIAFSVMTQSFVGALFTLAGFLQMAIWALGKHRNYIREFSNYPRKRKAIIPFLL